MAQATRLNRKRGFDEAEIEETYNENGLPGTDDYDFDNDNNTNTNNDDMEEDIDLMDTNSNNANANPNFENPAKRHTSFKRPPSDPNLDILEDHILETYDPSTDEENEGSTKITFDLIEEELAPSEDEDGNPIPIFKNNEAIITKTMFEQMKNLNVNVDNDGKDNNDKNMNGTNDEDTKIADNSGNNSNSSNISSNSNNSNNNSKPEHIADLAWESDEEMNDNDDKTGKETDTKINDATDTKQEVWFPNSSQISNANTEDEKYEYDQSSYTVFHQFNTEWPCLSFDFIKDNLGAYRTNIPHTIYLACGTQADFNYHNPNIYTPNVTNQHKEHYRTQNKLLFLKLSNLQKTKYDMDQTDENEENDKDYADITDEQPILQDRDILHLGGCVNRLRCHTKTNLNLVATWSEDSNVYIWDAKEHIKSLDGNAEHPELVKSNVKPVFETKNLDQGFGLAWSVIDEAKLLTGSCAGELCLYQPKSGSWIRTHKFKTPKTSIEDIAWSVNESNIFATASVDKCIRIFDTRPSTKCQCVSMVKAAHSDDINVLSWNPLHNHLLLTGSDDQSFKVWDLKKFPKASKKRSIKPHAHYKWHTGPITSVEWCPHDASTCSVSGEDNQITIWDLSLEEDTAVPVRGASLPENMKIPPQLVFVHAGQKEIKEVKWHPQIPNMIVSTAGSGFHVLQPDNLVQAMENLNLD